MLSNKTTQMEKSVFVESLPFLYVKHTLKNLTWSFLCLSVHEKEKLRGRDDKEDEEGGFGEYTRTWVLQYPSTRHFVSETPEPSSHSHRLSRFVIVTTAFSVRSQDCGSCCEGHFGHTHLFAQKDQWRQMSLILLWSLRILSPFYTRL